MKRRNVLASMGAFTASGSLVVGSSGFTSTEVERDVDIDVVGDEDAFLGLVYDDIETEEPPDTVRLGKGVYEETLVELRNQLGTDITVDEFVMEVESDDHVDVEFSEDPDDPGNTDCAVVGDPNGVDIERGECALVRVDVGCQLVRAEERSATVSFGVAVSGTGVSVETTRNREVVITCPESAEVPDSVTEGVKFAGRSGNAILQFETDVTGKPATVWGIDKSGTLTRREIDSLADAKIRPQNVLSASDDIAAVYFEGRTYFHQNLEMQENDGSVTYSIDGGSGSNSPTPRVCDGKVDLQQNPGAFGCWNDS
jgi:hypothetical protein